MNIISMAQLPNDFSYQDYLILNPDLNRYANREELKYHYLNYGYHEKRKYKYSSEEDKPKINILVVVLSCVKNKHLWDDIKKRTNNKLIIITGSDKNENFYDEKYKILYLKCNDLYDGLPEKIICMIDQVLKNEEFKDITHIIKIDDHDTFFTNKNIHNLYKCKKLLLFDYLGQKINTCNKENKGKYHFGKVPENSYWYNREASVPNIQYLDGGCIYILSRRAMEIINKKYNPSNIDTIRVNEIYEDVMVAKILNEHGIQPYQMNLGMIGDK